MLDAVEKLNINAVIKIVGSPGIQLIAFDLFFFEGGDNIL
jgi:hypothetical protein